MGTKFRQIISDDVCTKGLISSSFSQFALLLCSNRTLIDWCLEANDTKMNENSRIRGNMKTKLNMHGQCTKSDPEY